MIINNTPVRTSNNYGINDFVLPDNLFNIEQKSFDDLTIENNENICFVDGKLTNGNFLNTKLKCNFNKKIVLNKNTLNPVVLNFNLNKNNLVSNLFLEVDKNVNAKIVINLLSSCKSLHSGYLNIKVKENSFLDIVVINFLKQNSVNLFKQENTILENSKLNFTIVDFGGDYSVWQNKTNLNGNDGECNLDVVYLGTSNNKLDYNLEQIISGERCNSNINCVGALLNESYKNFKGTITFNKGCKKSVGNESEFCMLLSNKARSKALPMLLCKEEDVSGNHSTAVGKIDRKELFYIMSRGLTKLEATKLIVKAKFAQIVNKVFDDEVKEKILKEIDERIKGE